MDYSKGKIYQILNHVNDDIYIGMTCQLLSQRMRDHRCRTVSNKHEHIPLYKTMRDLGLNNFYIELIENFPCENKEQLKAREGYWIREKGTLNKVISGRGRREYYIDNKNRILDRDHDRYLAKKDEILKQKKVYYENNVEEILNKKKDYRNEHREEIRAQYKEFYEKNKERVRARRKELYQMKKSATAVTSPEDAGNAS
jgi:hypothetical protein